MRSKYLTLTLAAAFLLFAGTAQAGVLTSATWAGEFQGNPFTFTTGGGDLTASGTSTNASTYTAQITLAPQVFTTLQTGGAAPVFISETLGGNQAINNGVANQGVAGKVNVFLGTNAVSGLLLFTVPLTVGIAPAGGNPFFTITTLVPGFNIPVSVTASAFAWTTGTVNFVGQTLSGVGIPDSTVMGSNNLNATGVGSVTLVSPAITTICAGAVFQMPPFPCDGSSQQSHTGGATFLTLNYTVPEPGAILLLSAGFVTLAAVGRRKRS